MKDTVKAFKVLSDETKLRVLNLLLERECCVCEVMQALEISQSRASRSLIALYDAGFVKQRKEGLWSVYSIDEQGTSGFRSQLIASVRTALKNSPIISKDKKRLLKARRVGTGCAGKIVEKEK